MSPHINIFVVVILLYTISLTTSLRPMQLILGDCSATNTTGWIHRSDQRLVYRDLCATAVLPIGNGDDVILAKCNDNDSAQVWIINDTTWIKSAPNVSGSITLPKHPNSNAGWGFTHDGNHPSGATVVIYDVASRFHGECQGHHNCNFKFNKGQLQTYSGNCLFGAVVPPKPPSPPTPAPPPPKTFNFSSALGSHMVLQQTPAMSAVYGPVGDKRISAQQPMVRVVVSGPNSYTINATISSDGKIWKALLKPAQTGGNYNITATCTAGCSGSVHITDITFGDVWYCAGQSNMALPLLHTFNRNISRANVLSGAYDIRITGLRGNMNIDQPWTTIKDAAAGDPQKNNMFHFSSTCYYFGESLIEQLGRNAPPIGLIHTSFGGSMIEEWTTPDVIAKCAGTTPSYNPSSLWNSAVVPYLDTTVKGFIWYQGENNCHAVMGNSEQKVGYGCQLPTMVAAWRKAWSKTVGTTDLLAPFGVVTLASGTSEGGNDIGGMRFSQTANYGSLPNKAMPNSFLAHAYDLGDPWAKSTSCQSWGCCYSKYNQSNCAKQTHGKPESCAAACRGLMNTTYYMGPIHPRIKKPVGVRLAQAYTNLFGGKGAYTGPTISGCSVGKNTITVKFNSTLLRGGSVGVKPYDKASKMSAMRVLVDGSYWCKNTTLTDHILDHWGKWMCSDVNAPAWGGCGGNVQCGAGTIFDSIVDDINAQEAWVAVNIASTSTTEVTIDLSNLSGATPLALRYAWGQPDDTCCKPSSPTEPCIPGSCPIYSPESGLPANPFTAVLKAGKCKCIPPQVCNE